MRKYLILIAIGLSIGIISIGQTSCPSIFVPNAFTPNNDGVNDIFYVVTDTECWVSWKLTIFNRLGGVVWETSLVDDFWQGQSKSGRWYVPDGVYIWSIVAVNGIMSTKIHGHVAVFR